MKIRIHPLFILMGIYFAVFGKVFSFLTFTFTAIVHELGHSIVAEKLGYKLINLTLMPFGAIIYGDMDGLSLKDEIKVVISGPMVNLTVGLFIVATWWLFPDSYPYTELAFTANISLFAINLIPAFPLDGGRLLLAVLSEFLPRKKALKITKTVGIIIALMLIGLFVYSVFIGVNYTILLFAVFILAGIFQASESDTYMRLYDVYSPKNLKRGKILKEVAVSENCRVKELYGILSDGAIYRIFIYGEDGKLKKILEPEDLARILQEKSIYEKINV